MRGHGLTPAGLEGRLRVDPLTPFTWQDPASIERLVATVASFRPALIVVDSLARTNAADEQSAKEMAPMLNVIADLALSYDVAILLVHHFVKQPGKNTLLQNLRGSGAIGAVMRHLIGVEKKPKARETNVLEFDGNLHPLPEPMRVTLVDGKNAAGKPTLAFRAERTEHHGSDGGASITSEMATEIVADSSSGRHGQPAFPSKAGNHDDVDATLKLLIERGLVYEVMRGVKKVGLALTEHGERFAHDGVLPAPA